MVNNKKPISIRFSDEELIIIKNNASLANQSISQFIRQKVLNENNRIMSLKTEINYKMGVDFNIGKTNIILNFLFY